MSEPIRMIHFADVHIGTENYGRIDPETGVSSRILDFLRRFDEVIAFAEENDADLAIFAGDAFKSRSPTPTYQREFARRIRRLAQQCPVVLVAGNHDLPAMQKRASSIDIFHTLEVENVFVGRSDQFFHIETRRGPVQVATVPYPMRQRLMSYLVEESASLAELDLTLRDVITRIIQDLGAQVDPAIPAVLAGHFAVGGARLGSERSIMIGRDVEVFKSTLTDPVWDYVALGHIHFHQDLNGGGYPPVVYSGSLERIDFGEEGDQKGFCWVELARGETRYDFVEVAARPFVTIHADVRGKRSPMKTILSAIAKHETQEAVVRVIIQTTPEGDPLIHDREIEEVLGEAAFVAAIQHDIEHPARAWMQIEGGRHWEELSPLDLLSRYLSGKETPQDRIDLLLEHARHLLETEDGA